MSFGWRDVLNGLDEGLDVAKTDLQKGLMATTRAIARPEFF